jgi:hypothetical protein
MVDPVHLQTTMKTFTIKLSRGGKLRVRVLRDVAQVHRSFVRGSKQFIGPDMLVHGYFCPSWTPGLVGTIVLPPRETPGAIEYISHEANHAAIWQERKEDVEVNGGTDDQMLDHVQPVDRDGEERICTLTGEITRLIFAQLW